MEVGNAEKIKKKIAARIFSKRGREYLEAAKFEDNNKPYWKTYKGVAIDVWKFLGALEKEGAGFDLDAYKDAAKNALSQFPNIQNKLRPHETREQQNLLDKLAWGILAEALTDCEIDLV